jgi:hypothetical protein
MCTIFTQKTHVYKIPFREENWQERLWSEWAQWPQSGWVITTSYWVTAQWPLFVTIVGPSSFMPSSEGVVYIASSSGTTSPERSQRAWVRWMTQTRLNAKTSSIHGHTHPTSALHHTSVWFQSFNQAIKQNIWTKGLLEAGPLQIFA